MKTYEDGLNESWELAREIICKPDERRKIFGVDVPSAILKNYSALQAIEKVKEYEEIKVGDEVINRYGYKRVVTNTHLNGEITLMDCNGYFFAYSKEEVSDLKKTGRHFQQLKEILKQMKEDE
ncbi:MAG: hypothetical protein LIR46_07725 [Bacteroidota bacterium]|nr:hypothetical protein [Bacteroidota bacterium]